jgi:hypothetical protein
MNFRFSCALLGAMLFLASISCPDGHATPGIPDDNYVVVSASGRYFQLEDGTDFLPIGQNEDPIKAGIVNTCLSSDKYDPVVTREYFNKLRKHGINVIRTWVDAPGDKAQWDGVQLEKPIGVFDPEMVAQLDMLFEYAKDYDIYILVLPYDTFWMYESTLGAYDAAVGGPMHNFGDLLKSPVSLEYHKGRWRFLIDRYGGSNRVFAWDVMNEVDGGTWQTSALQVRDYVSTMSSFISQYERERWGKNHMITVSTVRAEPTGDRGYATYKHPNVDFSDTHMIYSPEMASRTDVTIGSRRVNQGIKYQLAQAPAGDPRPYINTEWWSTAENTFWNPLTPAFNVEQCHNVSWAHLASGGAGNGFYLTTWAHYYDGKFANDLAMSRIAKNIRWAHFNSRNCDSQLSVSGGNAASHTIYKMGCTDSRTVLAWLLNEPEVSTTTISGATLSVSGMTAGTYDCLFFDTRTAQQLGSSVSVAAGGVVSAAIPNFANDICAIFKHRVPVQVNAKPDAWITSPKAFTGVNSNSVVVGADAADDTGVQKVVFKARYGGTTRVIGEDSTPPYEITWNTSAIPDQSVEFLVDVTDIDGLTITDARQVSQVRLEGNGGDRTLPIASLESPGAGALIRDLSAVKLKAGAWDASSGVQKIQFWMEGAGMLGELYSPPYEMTVNLSAYDHSTRWVTVDVFDFNGNSRRPADFHGGVRLESAPVDETLPFGHFTSPAPGSIITAANPTLVLNAEAGDLESGVQSVTFHAFYDGSWKSIGTDNTAPYSLVWTPTIATNQMIALKMDVRDNFGRVATRVDAVGGIYYAKPQGDTWAPWCHIQSPSSYSTVTAPCQLRAIAGDRAGGNVAQVTFRYFYGGAWHTIGSSVGPDFAVTWDPTTAELPNAAMVTIAVEARDNSGNINSLADERVEVTVIPRNVSQISDWGLY